MGKVLNVQMDEDFYKEVISGGSGNVGGSQYFCAIFRDPSGSGSDYIIGNFDFNDLPAGTEVTIHVDPDVEHYKSGTYKFVDYSVSGTYVTLYSIEFDGISFTIMDRSDIRDASQLN